MSFQQQALESLFFKWVLFHSLEMRYSNKNANRKMNADQRCCSAETNTNTPRPSLPLIHFEKQANPHGHHLLCLSLLHTFSWAGFMIVYLSARCYDLVLLVSHASCW
ncbi:uncharacterized [Tachysurus ichikawai]